MDLYCDTNNAYNINTSTYNLSPSNNQIDLVEKARLVNESKKKKKDIYEKYRKPNINTYNLEHELNAFNKIQKYNNDKNIHYAESDKVASNAICPSSSRGHGNLLSPVMPDLHNNRQKYGFYSAQGEYLDCNKTADKNNNKDYLSIDTPSENSSISSESSLSAFSTMTFDTNEIDKLIKTKSKFGSGDKHDRHICKDFDLNSVDSLESLDSGESLLKHIRNCQNCRKKVTELIKKHTNNKRNISCIDTDTNITKETDIKNNITEKNLQKQKTSYFQLPELKEIITICMIGFLIIILLDLLIKNIM